MVDTTILYSRISKEVLSVKTLKITQLKPNPIGKDRPRLGGPTPTQLAAEWVDFLNTGNALVRLVGVTLYHVAYAPGERNGRWEEVRKFTENIEAGKVIRVHSGRPRDLSVIAMEDRLGADSHLFTGRDAYVWNNKEGDIASLWDTGITEFIDKASYDPNPPEGVILVRVGDKLVPAGVRV